MWTGRPTVLSVLGHQIVGDPFTFVNNYCKLSPLQPQANTTTHRHTHYNHHRHSIAVVTATHQMMAPEV